MALSQALGGMQLGLPTQAGRHAPSLLRGAASDRSASSLAQRRRCCGQTRAILAPAPVQQPPPQPQQVRCLRCDLATQALHASLSNRCCRGNGSQMLLKQIKLQYLHMLGMLCMYVPCNVLHNR
jgi:hypothetical protein